MLLKNKTAVVTGSNKGIGLEIIRTFSENGANIFACARNINDNFLKQINLIKKEYNNNITPIELDLADETKVKDASNKILSSDISIDILVNNAGIIQTSLFQMSSKKKIKEIFEINFFSQTIFPQVLHLMEMKVGAVMLRLRLH
jgi:3-oxoacyl-[acyl-carrier protein] reductase